MAESVNYAIIKDKTLKQGESVPIGDGSHAVHFLKGSTHPYGTMADSATLKILKPSGNFYGTDFIVATHPTLQDVTKGFTGAGQTDTNHTINTDPEKAFYSNMVVGSSIAYSGRSYLIAGNVTADEVEIKEFATPSVNKVWLSASPRISGSYAKGDVIDAGKAKVTVVNVGTDTVELTLVEADGKSTTRVFKNIGNPETLNYMPSDPFTRKEFRMTSSDDTVHVEVAILNPAGPIVDGKVHLDIYTDVFTLANTQVWPSDNRFLFRPDT